MTEQEKIAQLSDIIEAVAEARDKAEEACEKAARRLVLNFFEDDSYKSDLWWKTPNPMFGNIEPQYILDIKRSPKVLMLIVNMICGDYP